MSKRFHIPSALPAKLSELGVPAAAVLGSAGLPLDLFDQVRVLLPTAEFFALWTAIGAVASDPSIGLILGTEERPEHFSPIGLAALSTATFGEAARQLSRHKQLTCPEQIVQQKLHGEWSIQFHWTLAHDTEPDCLIDLCFAWLLSLARHGTGTRISPLRLELARPRTHARIFERHFNCPIVFSSAHNAIVFRASDADIPFVTQNRELLAMLAPQLDESLKRHQGLETFHERVRAIIQKKLAGRRPKMNEIASELHISSRTLQRRLHDSGLSFQQVLEDARHKLARHYLANSLLELNEAAYLLGYEDSGSFIRAFRTWEGVTPALWRGTRRTGLHSRSVPTRAPAICNSN